MRRISNKRQALLTALYLVIPFIRASTYEILDSLGLEDDKDVDLMESAIEEVAERLAKQEARLNKKEHTPT